MKKIFLMIGLAITTMASAQVLNVKSVEQLHIPTGDVKVAGISQDGGFVLLTTATNRGLRKYDMRSQQVETLTEAEGAGYNARILTDNKTVIYREKVQKKNNLQEQKLMLRDVTANRPLLLMRQTRMFRSLTTAGQVQEGRPVVSIEDRQLMLTVGGTTTMLSPCGTSQSYLWPSVSPDATHVLFYVAGRGAYVSDLSGKNVQFLGRDLRAPKWYSNSVIVGMNDQDNGEVTISSEIVAVTLDGQRQVLTSGINAMYPYAANGAIVCSGFNGETYLITVE